MNQPKFKFGDKVTNGECRPFEIHGIEWNFACQEYQYFSKSEKDIKYLESTLKEFQKKKLYAFIKKPFEVMFSPVDRLPDSYQWFERAPEYDLEYPEDK